MELQLLKTTEKRYQLLNQMNIFSLEDIVQYYPYRYDIIEEAYPSINDERIIIEAVVISPVKIFFRGRMSRMTFEVEDQYHQKYQVIIFNRHFLRQYLKLNTIITIIGKCQNHKITASDIKIKSINEIKGIHPVYSIKDGLTQKSFQQYVKKSLSLLNGKIESYVPEEMMIKHQLIHKNVALWNIHFPESQNDIKQSLKFLKYEEFLKFQLTMQLIKQKRSHELGIRKEFEIEKLQSFILNLPFQLTKDQQVAVKEIVEDLRNPQMMYRFLQGDVGSGKTVVSAIALYANFLAGYQGALMAPTEILARQHYQTLISFFKTIDIKIVLLTGSLSLKEKEIIYQYIQEGNVDIIVGTHALFQKKFNIIS